ncbi:hypothetical protein PIB30_105298, partial [Stylosanthes scabra]|nr:hypothetical protein [Stylosanthes scabra]
MDEFQRERGQRFCFQIKKISTPLESEGKTESVYPIGFSNGVSDRQELEAFVGWLWRFFFNSFAAG